VAREGVIGVRSSGGNENLEGVGGQRDVRPDVTEIGGGLKEGVRDGGGGGGRAGHFAVGL
jgi:hypothetical protein